MNAIIFYLTAFGYIDGEFDFTEKTFVRIYIRQLVTARAKPAMPDADAQTRDEIVNKFVAHFHEVFEQIDRSVKELFNEAVADGEDVEKFVYAKLKLRSYEIFQSFDRDNQHELLGDDRRADLRRRHRSTPPRRSSATELEALLDNPTPLDDADIEIVSAKPGRDRRAGRRSQPRLDDHPFFAAFEHHYSADPDRIQQQVDADLELMQPVRRQARRASAPPARASSPASRASPSSPASSRSSTATSTSTPPQPDGGLRAHRARRSPRLLHCLKARAAAGRLLREARGVEARHRASPSPSSCCSATTSTAGMFSYNGVLRTVMQLYLAAPEHVFLLRGNHEYYIEYRGRIYGGVKPAEAINTLIGHVPGEVFAGLHEAVRGAAEHAVLRRSDVRPRRHPARRATSRPSSSTWRRSTTRTSASRCCGAIRRRPTTIPDELQAQNARFPFGKRQFEAFMARLGCTMMVRGHEKVDAGFKTDVRRGRVAARRCSPPAAPTTTTCRRTRATARSRRWPRRSASRAGPRRSRPG